MAAKAKNKIKQLTGLPENLKDVPFNEVDKDGVSSEYAEYYNGKSIKVKLRQIDKDNHDETNGSLRESQTTAEGIQEMREHLTEHGQTDPITLSPLRDKNGNLKKNEYGEQMYIIGDGHHRVEATFQDRDSDEDEMDAIVVEFPNAVERKKTLRPANFDSTFQKAVGESDYKQSLYQDLLSFFDKKAPGHADLQKYKPDEWREQGISSLKQLLSQKNSVQLIMRFFEKTDSYDADPRATVRKKKGICVHVRNKLRNEKAKGNYQVFIPPSEKTALIRFNKALNSPGFRIPRKNASSSDVTYWDKSEKYVGHKSGAAFDDSITGKRIIPIYVDSKVEAASSLFSKICNAYKKQDNFKNEINSGAEILVYGCLASIKGVSPDQCIASFRKEVIQTCKDVTITIGSGKEQVNIRIWRVAFAAQLSDEKPSGGWSKNPKVVAPSGEQPDWNDDEAWSFHT